MSDETTRLREKIILFAHNRATESLASAEKQPVGAMQRYSQVGHAQAYITIAKLFQQPDWERILDLETKEIKR